MGTDRWWAEILGSIAVSVLGVLLILWGRRHGSRDALGEGRSGSRFSVSKRVPLRTSAKVPK